MRERLAFKRLNHLLFYYYFIDPKTSHHIPLDLQGFHHLLTLVNQVCFVVDTKLSQVKKVQVLFLISFHVNLHIIKYLLYVYFDIFNYYFSQ